MIDFLFWFFAALIFSVIVCGLFAHFEEKRK